MVVVEPMLLKWSGSAYFDLGRGLTFSTSISVNVQYGDLRRDIVIRCVQNLKLLSCIPLLFVKDDLYIKVT